MRPQPHQTLKLNLILSQFHQIPSSELFVLSECNEPLLDRFLPKFRDNLSIPSSRVKQSTQNSSVSNYQSTLLKIPEDIISNWHLAWRLPSHSLLRCFPSRFLNKFFTHSYFNVCTVPFTVRRGLRTRGSVFGWGAASRKVAGSIPDGIIGNFLLN